MSNCTFDLRYEASEPPGSRLDAHPIKEPMKTLTLRDFADSFGTGEEDLSAACAALVENGDFRYRDITGVERDELILKVLMRIDADTQTIGAFERREAWNKGWQENLQEYINSGYDRHKLVPKFIRLGQPVRFRQSYIEPHNPGFELAFIEVFRRWFFEKYLREFSCVYEFGCGTGFNLVALAEMFPDKMLFGLDFVPSAVELVTRIGETQGIRLTGRLFDMVTPDYTLEIKSDSAVFTFGAIEQLAGRFDAFLDYLLMKKPALCAHIEPTVELYDQNNLVDHLAIKFHRKRGYTEGLLPRIQKLASRNLAELIKVKRLFFGSLYMEGYSLIVWRPRR